MWLGHHEFWFCPIWFLFFVLVAGFFFVRFFRFRNDQDCRRRWSNDAVSILKKRLASGEIDEAEYERLKDVLKK